MAMEKMILTNVSLEELAEKIAEIIQLSGQGFVKNQDRQETKEIKEYLSLQEASELIQLAKPTIYGLTHRNEIPFIKKGKKLWYKRSELLTWLDSGRKQTREETEEQAMLQLKSSHRNYKSR
jgi:excisionase family DNA binding protein